MSHTKYLVQCIADLVAHCGNTPCNSITVHIPSELPSSTNEYCPALRARADDSQGQLYDIYENDTKYIRVLKQALDSAIRAIEDKDERQAERAKARNLLNF